MAYKKKDGKAPKSHASSATTYGVGTTSNYGHVNLLYNKGSFLTGLYKLTEVKSQFSPLKLNILSLKTINV